MAHQVCPPEVEAASAWFAEGPKLERASEDWAGFIASFPVRQVSALRRWLTPTSMTPPGTRRAQVAPPVIGPDEWLALVFGAPDLAESPCQKAAQLCKGISMKKAEKVPGKPDSSALTTCGVKQVEWALRWTWSDKHCPQWKELQAFFWAEGQELCREGLARERRPVSSGERPSVPVIIEAGHGQVSSRGRPLEDPPRNRRQQSFHAR